MKAKRSGFWPCSYGRGAGPVVRLFYGTHMEEGGDGGCNVVTTEGSEPKEIRIFCSFLNRICGPDHTHDILYLYLHIDQMGSHFWSRWILFTLLLVDPEEPLPACFSNTHAVPICTLRSPKSMLHEWLHCLCHIFLFLLLLLFLLQLTRKLTDMLC